MAIRPGPWAPFEPTANDAWDLRRVAHLHRRAGFCATRAELQRDLKAGPAASVERLLRPPPRPTEDQAREFLELFTLGVGRYTEKDVREAARALAGWVRRREEDGGHFFQDPALSDAGAKTFLGRTGPWTQDDIVRLTLEQPACA